VTCQKSAEQLRQCEDYASCCCAVQNLMLYLSEAGVATKWTTGHITRDRRLFELLNIDPDEEFVVGLFWYGYPRILPDQSRKPLSEIITVID
jgi:nitroreductase